MRRCKFLMLVYILHVSVKIQLGAVDNWFSSHLTANWPLTVHPLPPSLLTAIRGSFLWKKKENEGKNVDTEKGLGKVVNSNSHAVYPLPPLNGQFAVKRDENQLSTAPKLVCFVFQMRDCSHTGHRLFKSGPGKIQFYLWTSQIAIFPWYLHEIDIIKIDLARLQIYKMLLRFIFVGPEGTLRITTTNT